ncbi:hypothetical protein GCM10009855_30880 [Gordonia cholesterolivorans]|uniref:Uncharacterized protein n=1 Tax=Gordonia cholesterolivorans TaxID=559625 RepID=A0ABN3HV22_9ACTN
MVGEVLGGELTDETGGSKHDDVEFATHGVDPTGIPTADTVSTPPARTIRLPVRFIDPLCHTRLVVFW